MTKVPLILIVAIALRRQDDREAARFHFEHSQLSRLKGRSRMVGALRQRQVFGLSGQATKNAAQKEGG